MKCEYFKFKLMMGDSSLAKVNFHCSYNTEDERCYHDLARLRLVGVVMFIMENNFIGMIVS